MPTSMKRSGNSSANRASPHGGRDGDDALVGARFGDEGLAEHVGVARDARWRLRIGTRQKIVGADAMEALGVVFCGFVARTLLRDHVHEHGTVSDERGLEDVAHRGDVVAVDGRRAQDAQLLENHGARHHELLERVLHVAPELHERVAERTAPLLHLRLRVVSHLTVARRRAQRTQDAYMGLWVCMASLIPPKIGAEQWVRLHPCTAVLGLCCSRSIPLLLPQ